MECGDDKSPLIYLRSDSRPKIRKRRLPVAALHSRSGSLMSISHKRLKMDSLRKQQCSVTARYAHIGKARGVYKGTEIVLATLKVIEPPALFRTRDCRCTLIDRIIYVIQAIKGAIAGCVPGRRLVVFESSAVEFPGIGPAGKEWRHHRKDLMMIIRSRQRIVVIV